MVVAACAQEPVHERKNIKIVPREGIRLKLGGNEKHSSGYMLLYHRIAYGLQLEKPAASDQHGKVDADPSRLATTYYHRHSPIGLALERFNWFPGPANTYWADARLPASVVAGASQHAFPNLLATFWSEPPVGVVGLHMGTLASYARPLQPMHFFEHNPDFIEMNFDAPEGKRWFHFVPDARARGAAIQAFQGDSRDLLQKAPDGFYQVLVVEAIKEGFDQKLRKKLLTREGIKLCMSKLTPGGLLCFHTSCRYYQLDELITAVAESLGYAVIVGRDGYIPDRDDGAYTSEWVIVARAAADLKRLKPPPNYAELRQRHAFLGDYWQKGRPAKVVWSDEKIDYRGLYRADPYLVPALRETIYGILNNVYKTRGPNSAVRETIEGVLRAIDGVRVRELNSRPPPTRRD
jgi:hypothetical protein